VKGLVKDLLTEAGIEINGSRPWDIIIHNENFYNRLLNYPDLALGEMYMEGWWDCVRLDEFFFRVLNCNLERKAIKHPELWISALSQRFFENLHKIFNYQTKSRAFIVGKKHYDVGYDLYQVMLDKRLVYTCGYWENAKTLDEAQEAKLHLTCQKLGLKPGMTLLDIGCGFGSLAKFAAENYKVSVVGVTISENQCEGARKLCQGLPVEIRFQDYRDLIHSNLKFDRIASLGMFEHVGYKNYADYMKISASCLKDDGIFLLHTIGGNLSRVTCGSRFIDTYIFPNGQIPSIAQIGQALEGNFVMEDWHNFGPDYDKTLMAWHHNFNRHWDTIKDQYDEQFRRMWNYYLLSCAASFRTRHNQLWQIVLTKKGLASGFAFNRYQQELDQNKIEQLHKQP
jgi:cyclopropane-fatty-acyl-phospholipid synthase